jgi:archaemetzincin
MEQYLERNTPIKRPPNTIYLQPLGEDILPILVERLHLVIQGFYCRMQVKVLKPLALEKLKVKSRMNGGQQQYNAVEILEAIRALRPKDAFCMVGFLVPDLYHREDWNYVFGLANSDIYSGVFSFARYHDSFGRGGKFPDYEGGDDIITVTFRACAVLVHEIGHLFDLRHCISYRCAMNGQNSLEEACRIPFLFCPNCLRKIVYKINTDPATLLDSFHRAVSHIGEGQFGELSTQLLQ